MLPVLDFGLIHPKKNNRRWNSTIQLLAEFSSRHPTFRFRPSKIGPNQEKIHQLDFIFN